MAAPNRIIRDYRNEPEKALNNRRAVIAAERARGRVIGTNLGRVIPPYYPREPVDSGDPFSASGVKIAFSELDPALQALITGGSGGNLRVRSAGGSPDVSPVDDIVVPSESIISVGGTTIQLLFAKYAGDFEAAAVGTGDIPLGQWGFWYDTTNNQQWLVRNRGNTLFYVELTC